MSLVCFFCPNDASAQCEVCKRWLCKEHSTLGLIPEDPFKVLCPDHAQVITNKNQQQLLQQAERQKQDEHLRRYGARKEELKQYCKDTLEPVVRQIARDRVCSSCDGKGYIQIDIKPKKEGGRKPQRYDFISDEEHKSALDAWRGRKWSEGSSIARETASFTGRDDPGYWANTSPYINRDCAQCGRTGTAFDDDELERRLSELASLHPEVVQVTARHVRSGSNVFSTTVPCPVKYSSMLTVYFVLEVDV